MKSFVISFAFIACLTTTNIQCQVLWPVQPQNQAHSISGTIGEYRNTYRFHQGVDITNGSNHNIYAVEAGQVTAIANLDSKYVSVSVTGPSGIVTYTHCDPSNAVSCYENVYQGQLLGVMADENSFHVHLSSNVYLNYLAHRLCNYVDNSAPVIHGVYFKHNGLNLLHDTPSFSDQTTVSGEVCNIVYNKVDIMSRVDDLINGATCAPDRISYEIFNQNNESINNGATTNFNFESATLNTAATSCFGFGTTFSPAVYNYVLTSHPSQIPYSRYWNTGLRDGVIETWPGNTLLDARVNEESHYPDGKYNVQIVARDVDFDNTFNQTVRDCPVVVDNFRPFVSEVTVRKESEQGQIIYNGNWCWTAGVLSFNNPVNNPAFNPDKMWIKITCSESMAEVWLKTGGFSGMIIEPVAGTMRREWIFVLPMSDLVTGINKLKIWGQDLAGNQMQEITTTEPVYASEIPVHMLDGSWFPAPAPGWDVIHAFKIQLQSAAVANFSPLETTINVGDQVVFTDLSTNNPNQWDWSFDGGDPEFSSLQNPVVTYNYEGDYVVVLHVMNQAGMSSLCGMVHVTTATIPPVAAFSPDNINIAPGGMVDFADLSSGNPDTWLWNFGGGSALSTQQNPEAIFDYEGQYTVTLQAGNAAGTSIATGIVNVSFAYMPIDVLCTAMPFMAVVGTPVNFSGTVINGIPPYEFLIDPGDGSMQLLTGNSPNFSLYQTFDQNGDYSMTVTVIDGNGNTGTCGEIITIYGGNPCASLHVDFITAGSQLSAAVGAACTFIDQTTGGSQPYLYAWHFYPDPQTGAQPSAYYSFNMTPPPVVFSQSGMYPVSLHVYDNNGCAQTVMKDIHVFVPQHCLVAQIGIGDQDAHKIPLGSSCFWDFSYSVSEMNCSDPPGSGNMPCETQADWKLMSSSGNLLAYKHTHPNDPLACSPNGVNEVLFAHNFNTSGKYKLKLRIWDDNCSVLNGYTCEDEVSVQLDVVDCSNTLDICNSLFLPMNYGDFNAGKINVAGNNCFAVYLSGSRVGYHAFDEIRLMDGVHISQGAAFVADIENCPETMPCDKHADINNVTESADEILIFPNPSSGTFTVATGNSAVISSMFIQDAAGRTVQAVPVCDQAQVDVDLGRASPGIYVVKIVSRQQVYTRRLEVIK